MRKFVIQGLGIALACCAVLSLTSCQSQMIGMLNPKGIIAYEERKLFFDTLALMLIVVLPVIIMSFVFVYHYQSAHRLKDYKPNWGHSLFLESLWWGIPCVIIVVLAILTWKKTRELDPFNTISNQQATPILIKVIALPWKWLFIYPEQNIATINEMTIPEGVPVEYWITTDNVPMSAFFIPQLGSQIYTMTGMRSRLFLLANQPGDYDGMNTQFNGEGFYGMHFTVHVVTADQMQQWINTVKKSTTQLNDAAYLQLLHPSISDQPQYFSSVQADLFENVMMTYMHSEGNLHPRQLQAPFYSPSDLQKE